MIDKLTPPHDDEAEEALIGSCLIDQEVIYRLKGAIDVSEFYNVKNQWAWAALLKLASTRQPIDAVTLRRALEASGQIDEIGGPSQITYYMTVVPTAIHAEGYADIVKRQAINRRLLKSAEDIARLAYANQDEYDKLSTARASIASIQVPTSSTETAESVASRVYDKAVEYHENPIASGDVRGVKTGLIDFDYMLGGIGKKKTLVFAGRPAMGKSTLVDQVGFMAAEHGARVLVFTIEMTNDEVMMRQQSRLTGIPYELIEDGRIPANDWPKMSEALERLSSLPVMLDDNTMPTIGYIESIILKHGPFDLVVIDHLGLMSEIQKCRPSELVTIIGKVTRAFKNIAKEYDTCVIEAVQLSRRCEERDDKRPVLSDLRDSGRIEEDADEVYMLYRDDYYNPETLTPNVTEVIRRKGRSKAAKRSCALYFDGPTTSFKNAVTREVRL